MGQGADTENPATHIIRWLKSFYWILLDILNVFEGEGERAHSTLKFYLALDSNRVRILARNLGLALEYIGESLSKRPDEETLRKDAGSLPVETLRKLRETMSSIIEHRTDNLMQLSIILLDNFEFAVTVLRTFSRILEESGREEYRKVGFVLQIMVQDLEILRWQHHQLMRTQPGR